MRSDGADSLTDPFLGILVGLVGVGVLAGLHPEGGWWAAAGTLAIVVASFSYACANHFVQHNYGGTSPLVIATVSCATGALILLPFAVVQWPDAVPSRSPLRRLR